MNDKILHQLEFKKIIENLITQAETSLGKELASSTTPSSSLLEVQKWHEETDEGVQVLRLKGHVPLGGISDIRPHIKRASIGGMLSAVECLEVASTIYGGQQFKKFVYTLEEEEIEIPILEEWCEQISNLNNLERSIKNCIDEYGQVMDGASSKLRTIRSQIRSYESRVRDRLEGYTKSKSQMLSDAIVTIRNERYVIPVKSEYRSSFGGIVHDQSSSGQTLFIEPQSVVDLNNKLQESRVEEQHEIERILESLSGLIEQDAEFLRQNVDALQQIDFMFAKAKLSRSMKASKPEMNQDGVIHMRQARHPLIPSDEVVSNDVELGEDFTAIVITGPNTGGKTVTLKMVGLCTLMAQSGLQVPALDGCQMAVFEHVFADIGDEQSIEQSLSTFSSHMTNIVDILERVNSNSLVLFDELGAGTDPQEGAGLAMSILDHVISKSARVIATTHYPELKAYGYNRTEVTNASVEFDVETLKPTYRLLLGVPGRSNAFDISKRLGLKDEVIEKAQSMVSDDSRSVENMIASLEQSRHSAERDYEEASSILSEAEQFRDALKHEYNQYLNKKEQYEEKAKSKAQKIIEEAEVQSKEILEELKELKEDATVKEHHFIDARKKLEEQKDQLKADQKSSQAVNTEKKNEKLLPGDEVHVATFNQNGYIIEQVNEQEYEVQLGIMKMKVSKGQLQFVKRPEPVKTKPLATVKGSQVHVKPELDLRGQRYEDAIHKLEKYIDDALLAGYHQVSIIHGKGTGALMKGVQQFAKEHRSIKGNEFASANEGGTGVTILKLK
ncbi:DNA mismatch repair protein MutS2 [Alkalibacillus filiformis]|uniref:Endonuclease MutS2 n=1 Tax=Alkalibacillus filiformis TaxID=200990 RepID=A0ABU0DRY2_9BACI|nr:endonuclease MutS2 [Alkalibacillus filiformis]MDQ0351201.1 DNA mismatch repair protein MutS2 [Alkalibacillus filiformis]